MTGHLKFWQAVLVDVASLLVVIINGTRPLVTRHFQHASNFEAVPTTIETQGDVAINIDVQLALFPMGQQSDGRYMPLTTIEKEDSSGSSTEFTATL